MTPSEVLAQNRHLRLIWPKLGKSNHVEQVLPAETGPVFVCQLSRQCRDNSFPIFSSNVAENIPSNTQTDLPVEQHQFRIDGLRNPEPG